MIYFTQIIEKINEPIRKIRGITETGEYAEVRIKPNFILDVRVAPFEGANLRVIFKKEVKRFLSLNEIIEYLDIKMPKEVDNSKIVLINGYNEVGKDTFVNCCNKYIRTKNISSVDKIKTVAKVLGWDGITKDEKTREFLSSLKLLSTGYNDDPFEYVKSQIEDFISTSKHGDNKYYYGTIFIHVREPEEIQKIKNAYPEAITLLIKNNRIKQVDTNMADLGVFNFEYDYTINNDSTIAVLEGRALWFISQIFEEKI